MAESGPPQLPQSDPQAGAPDPAPKSGPNPESKPEFKPAPSVESKSDSAPGSRPGPASASASVPRSDWAKATLGMVIVGVIGLNLALIIRSCRTAPGEVIDKVGQVIQKAGQALADVASAFKQGRVTTEFISYATSLTNQQHLQFAMLKQTELFTRTEGRSTGFGYIPLPEIVVEARAPVEYTYYLDLNARWDLVLKDDVIFVFAPPIQFNKPAVDASAITYEVRKGYLKTAEAQENLKKSITSLVTLRAKDNISLIRENARRQTTEFVEHWMSGAFQDGKHYPVKVFFPDEKPPAGVESSHKPLP